jgi:hypothetical protein
MRGTSDLSIFILWLVAAGGAILLFVGAAFLDPSGGLRGWAIDVDPGDLRLWLVQGGWFAISSSAFWEIRRRRRDDAALSDLALAWAVGLLLWLALWTTTALGGSEQAATIFAAAILAAAVSLIIRSRVFLLLSLAATIFPVLAVELVLLWPAFLFAALACWSSGTFESPRRDLCPNCSYDIRGLPGSVCPECGKKFI